VFSGYCNGKNHNGIIFVTLGYNPTGTLEHGATAVETVRVACKVADIADMQSVPATLTQAGGETLKGENK